MKGVFLFEKNIYNKYNITILHIRRLTMKKLLVLILALVMIMSLTACGGNDIEEKGSSVDILGVWTDGGLTERIVKIYEGGDAHMKDATIHTDGSWTLEGSTLTVETAGGTAWVFEVVEDGENVNLVVRDGLNNEDWVFEKEE